jgi:uncharacterized Zn finger protein/superfamily II DNA or RNA helicase
MAVYGKTWWGEKWLEAFNGIDEENRLPRGRSYAHTGRAHSIHINGNIIQAKVSGTRSTPYGVKIVLKPFTTEDQETIRQTITDSPAILSGLLNRQLPLILLERLNGKNIKLLPTNWKDLSASCTCPDWAIPCKHIAAVLYMICAEIDKNPFVVFSLHDCDLLSLISDFTAGQLENIQKITLIEDLFKDKSTILPQPTFDQSVLSDITFSMIPDLSERIPQLLSNCPPFYDKNFHDVLCLAYKHWRKYPSGKLHEHFELRVLARNATKKNQSEEDHFLEKWNHPERWQHVHLTVDHQNQLTQVTVVDDGALTFPNHGKLHLYLATFLKDIPITLLHKLCPEVRFMHTLSLFATQLMEKSALIPHILQNKKKETLIRWVPALFDVGVKEIFQKLCSTCPADLVQQGKVSLCAEEQVKTVLSFIFQGHMEYNFPASLDRHQDQEVFGLFFKNISYQFDEFHTKNIPPSIHQWLLKLFVSNRPHKLYLTVDDISGENGPIRGDFSLGVKVSLDGQNEPTHLYRALLTCTPQEKLIILSDLALLLEYMPMLEPTTRRKEGIPIGIHEFSPLFINVLPALKAVGIIIVLPKSLHKVLAPKLDLRLKVKDTQKDNQISFLNLETLMDFDWKVAIGDKKLTVGEFKALVKQSRGLVRLIDEYVLFDEKDMAHFLKSIDQLPDHLSQVDLMHAALAGEFEGAHIDLDERLKDLFKGIDSPAPVKVPENLRATLRPYQERGFSWLVQNIQMGFGSILADDMGLGKTLQVIATVLHLKNTGHLSHDKVLIVTPTSLLSNWQREVERFAPDLRMHIYHGSKRELEECDIVLTSYGVIRRDQQSFHLAKWLMLVIDEAQNIKNPTTAQTKSLKLIKATHKIALSGTPVENRLLDYWSIFDFTNKSYLGTQKQFKNRFATPIETHRDKSCLDRFNKVTGPFILRRLKSDKNIIQDLPEKIETNRYCNLTPEQTALYQGVVDKAMITIDTSEGIERKGLVLKLINALKQICNHPSQFGKKKKAEISQSGKMEMLEDLICEIDALAEKTIIFTQYTEMGKILAKLLEERFTLPALFLHGGLSRKARDEMVEAFQTQQHPKTLIVSLKAGGTGLNLTAANHVIHYDLWWNPAVEAQATDRAYRIGQQKNVMVHRLITANSFEERIDAMIQNKKELANLTLSSGETWITEMSNDQLRDLVDLRSERP